MRAAYLGFDDELACVNKYQDQSEQQEDMAMNRRLLVD